MAWFRKDKKPLKASDKRELPPDVFDKCEGCGEIVYGEKMSQNLGVCPHCGFHTRIGSDRYLEILLDADSFRERDADLRSVDALNFTDRKSYESRIDTAIQKVGQNDAVVSGEGEIEGIPVCIAVMDFRFIGGSMGSVVGEKIARIGRVARG